MRTLLKFHSWNVNGFRAALGKGFSEYVTEHVPDFLCLQETKASPEQVSLPDCLRDWHASWNVAEKKGYSGTAIFSKQAPVSVLLGMKDPRHDQEGRVISAEFEKFWLVNVYTPNAQDELRRLPYRQAWDRDFLEHLQRLEQTKPVILCGDLNVSHTELDIARPKENRNSAGFSDEERAGFTRLIEAGFIDTFRHLHPGESGHYSWWSFRGGPAKGMWAGGSTISASPDHYCRSWSPLRSIPQVTGSDHCPVEAHPARLRNRQFQSSKRMPRQGGLNNLYQTALQLSAGMVTMILVKPGLEGLPVQILPPERHSMAWNAAPVPRETSMQIPKRNSRTRLFNAHPPTLASTGLRKTDALVRALLLPCQPG
ncbi:MAG: exodeoxyribonuclease III [Verrucomicrobiales bacterium]